MPLKPALGLCPPGDLLHALRTTGLRLDLGELSVHVRSDVEALAWQIRAAYPHFPCVAADGFADLHVALDRVKGWRRWLRPQVDLVCDGVRQFHPFPADTALPLLEWGINGLVADRFHHLLLLHAGAVERDGLALLLPAIPGSGKSTLTAALIHRGWRLLSDEFGALDLATRTVRAILKPIALKNESIGVIRRFAPEAVMGPEFPRTRKGTVCHVAAPVESVRGIADAAVPAMVVLPKWVPSGPTRLEPLAAIDVFRALAFNSFNYEMLGRDGFTVVAAMARTCEGWSLEYSDLDDVVERLDEVWTRGATRRVERLDEQTAPLQPVG